MVSQAAPPWKWLLLSSINANSNLKHSSFFQLAIVTSDDKPSNRTVVLRGFQDATANVQINTDTRSSKIPWCFSKSWEQFHIRGPVDVIDGNNPDPWKLQAA